MPEKKPETTQEPIRTNEEFLIEILRLAMDFNSQITTVATAEVAGDPSTRNRTRQRKVVADLQMLGTTYNRKLDQMYQQREIELKGGEEIASDLSHQDAASIRRVIAILDSRMEKEPNQQLADTSNYLELILKNPEGPKTEETKAGKES